MNKNRTILNLIVSLFLAISRLSAVGVSTLVSEPGILDGIDPIVQITSPSEPDSFTYGLPMTIQWVASDSSFGARPVYIELRKGDASLVIAENTENDSLYQWTIPEIGTGFYQIAIVASDSFGNNATALSDQFFILGVNSENSWYVSQEGDDINNNGTAAFPYASIQRALDNCRDGDSVFVSFGVYTEAINTNGKSVYIKGVDGWENTVISGEASQTEIVTLNGSSYFAGFTVANTENYNNCDGIHVVNGNLTTIEKSRIRLCNKGLVIDENSKSVIKNNLISDCVAAIECQNNTELIIENNTIVAGQSGITVVGSDVALSIKNNIIANNQGVGGVVFNESPEIDPIISYNNIWNNEPQNYSGYYDLTGTDGNISKDPLFIDYAGMDLHLSALSPSVNSGDPDYDYQSEPEPNGDRINMGCYGNTDQATVQQLQFTNQIQSTVEEDSLYNQVLDLPWEDNVNITVTVAQLPDWLSVDQGYTLISGTPNNSHVGSHSISLYAEDNYDRKDTLEYQLIVINTPPIITSNPITIAWEKEAYSYDVNCSDDGQGDIRYYIQEPMWLSIDSLSGMVGGTPQNADVGQNNVKIEVRDGNGGITLHTYTLNVRNINDPPVLSRLPDLNIAEDQPAVLLFENWQPYVSDIDNDFSELQWQVEKGENIIAESFADSAILTPVKDWYGADSVKVIVADSTLADTSYLRLFVSPVNDYPVWSLPGDTSLYFGDSLMIDLYEFVDDVDDPDSNMQITFATGFNPDDYYLSITLEHDRILKILPIQNYALIDGPVYLSVEDTAGYSVVDTLLLTVYKYNFPPQLAQLPDITGREDVPVTVLLEDWWTYVTDRDDSLQYLSWYIPSTEHVTVETGKDTVIFYPQQDWFGVDSIDVYVLDEKDTASVQIIITFRSVADRPLLSLDNFQFCEDDTLVVHLDEYVEDVDTPDSLLLWNITYENGSIISPVPEFHHEFDTTNRILQCWGDLNFFVDSVLLYYSVTDDSNLTASANSFVTISPVNDPPDIPEVLSGISDQFEDMPFIIDISTFRNEISDVETPFDSLEFNINSSDNIFVNNVINDAVFALNSRLNWFGHDTLRLDVSDDSCTVQTRIPIFVNPVNDLPVIKPIPDTTFFEDDSITLDLKQYVSDIDTPTDSLKFRFLTDSQQSILVMQFDSTNWKLNLKGIPDGFIDSVIVIYQVWDNPDSCASDTNYVSILAVNDPPVLIGSLDTSYYEDEHLILTQDYLMTRIFDVDDEVSELTVNISGDSGLVFCEFDQINNLYKFYSGTDVDSCGYFSIHIIDPHGASVTEPFVVDVIPVNDAPVLTGFPDTSIAQNSVFYLQLEDYYFDIDNVQSDIDWVVNAAKSDVFITESKDSLVCTPPFDYVGWDTIYVTISDPDMMTDMDTFRIHFDDAVPPEFTIGIFQNPIASEHIKVYYFPSEPIDTIYSAMISGNSVNTDLVTDIIPSPYYTSYQLFESAAQQIVITGADTCGNIGTTNYNFSVSYIFKESGGSVFSPDSTVQIIIADNSISSNMFVLCLPNVCDSSIEKQKSTLMLAKITAKITGIDNTFKSTQNVFYKKCKIIFNISDQNNLSANSYQGIFRYEGDKWIYIKTFTDDEESCYWSYVDKLGRYTLSGNAPQAPEKLPSEFALGQNYPNPFNMETTITFELPEIASGLFESSVKLTVYNILGRRVATVVNRKMAPGRYTIQWNGINDSGLKIASGVYFYSLNYGQYIKTKKMVLLK